MQKTIGRFFSFFTAMLLCMNMFTVFTAGAEESMQTDEEPTMSNDMSIEGSNSFGTMLAKEISGKQEEQLENNGCNVFSVEVSGQTAKVDFETTEDLSLVVAVYEEDGVKMLTSAETDVTAEQTDIEVTFEEQLPQYFYVRAFLVEKESLKPMCAAYETPNYTKEMQEFFAKTTDDFDEKRVLNLDEDKTNNFAVFGEDTRIIENAGDKNILVSSDDENLTYVFENADESISGLKKDDIFTYALEDGMQLIVKVDSVKTDGSKVTIVGQDTSMEDVFNFVKIDSAKSEEPKEVTVDYSTVSEELTYSDENSNSNYRANLKQASTEFNQEISEGIKFEFKKSANINGFVSFNVTADLKCYYCKPNIWDTNNIEVNFVDFVISTSQEFNVNISAKFKKDFNLAKYIINTPCLGLYVSIVPVFHIDGSAALEFSAKYTHSFGVSCSNDDTNGYVKEKKLYPVTLKIEGKANVGFIIKVKLALGVPNKDKNKSDFDLFAIELDTSAMLQLKGEILLYSTPVIKYKHDNWKCFEGELGFNLESSIEFESGQIVNKWINITEKEKLLLGSFYTKISDFYCHENDYGLTRCPHKIYRFKITVLDENNKPIQGANVKYDYYTHKSEDTTNENGEAYIYLRAGSEQLVHIVKDGYNKGFYHAEFNYDDVDRFLASYYADEVKSGEVTLEKIKDSNSSKPDSSSSKPNSSSEADSSSNTSEFSGTCGENLTWTLQDGILIISGTGKMNDYYTRNSDIPWYKQRELIKKVIIKDGVESISRNAFYGCSNLTNVIIPNSITSIGNGTFHDCHNLVNINIPSSVTNIGASAFTSCVNLTNITIPNSVTSIGSAAFSQCYNLNNIKIPDSVITIGDCAFQDCKSLTSIIIPNSVTSIERCTFNWCNNLESVIIPDNVTSIDEYAFSDSKNVTIYCSPNSTAESYAKENNIPYAYIGTKSAASPLKTAAVNTLENLEPNTVYNIYVMKDKSAENPLSTENLLCITQTKTDENGNITTKYAPKAEIAGAETFAVNFADDEENEQPEIVIGDVDFSGTINSSDALKVLIHIVGVKRLDENQFKAADTNGDNEITTIDALNILKYVVGLISQFTA